jgi:hypothetical protein
VTIVAASLPIDGATPIQATTISQPVPIISDPRLPKRKRTRRAPSPLNWIPESLKGFKITDLKTYLRNYNAQLREKALQERQRKLEEKHRKRTERAERQKLHRVATKIRENTNQHGSNEISSNATIGGHLVPLFASDLSLGSMPSSGTRSHYSAHPMVTPSPFRSMFSGHGAVEEFSPGGVSNQQFYASNEERYSPSHADVGGNYSMCHGSGPGRSSTVVEIHGGPSTHGGNFNLNPSAAPISQYQTLHASFGEYTIPGHLHFPTVVPPVAVSEGGGGGQAAFGMGFYHENVYQAPYMCNQA